MLPEEDTIIQQACSRESSAEGVFRTMGAPAAPKTATSNRNPGLLLGSLLACLLLVGAYAVWQASPLINAQAYVLQVLGQAADHLRLTLDKYEGITFQFVANRDLNKLLVDYVQAKDNYDVAVQNQGFANYLEGYAFSDPGIYDALFLDEANTGRKALTMGEAIPNSFIRTLPGSDLYRAVLAADGRAVWFGGVQLGSPANLTVAVGRRVKHLFTGRPLGVLVVFLRQDHLTSLVTDYLQANFYWSLGTLRGNYVMLADGGDRIISTALPGNLGRKASDVVTPAGPLSSFLPRQRQAGSFLGQVKKDHVLVAYRRLRGTEWTLLAPVSGALVGSATRGLFVFLAVLAVGVAAIATGIWVPQRARTTPSVRSVVVEPRGGGQEQAEAEPAWLSTLSDREKEILRLLAQGRSNKEIAGAVFVAEQTVKNYVSTIYHKLDVHDRVQAARKAIQAGLLHD